MRCWSACQALQVARQDHGMRHHSTSSVHKHKELPQRFCHSPRGERCICWRFHEAAMAACLAAHAQMSRSRAESELVMAACTMLCTSCASIVHTGKVRNHGAMSLCVSITECRKSCMMPSHRVCAIASSLCHRIEFVPSHRVCADDQHGSRRCSAGSSNTKACDCAWIVLCPCLFWPCSGCTDLRCSCLRHCVH